MNIAKERNLSVFNYVILLNYLFAYDKKKY